MSMRLVIQVPFHNDNRTDHERFTDLLIDMAVTMATVGLPRCYDEVARRVARRAVDMLESRK